MAIGPLLMHIKQSVKIAKMYHHCKIPQFKWYFNIPNKNIRAKLFVSKNIDNLIKSYKLLFLTFNLAAPY